MCSHWRCPDGQIREDRGQEIIGVFTRSTRLRYRMNLPYGLLCRETAIAMGACDTITLQGSGMTYSFAVCPLWASTTNAGGVYAILHDGPVDRIRPQRSLIEMRCAQRDAVRQWQILYIGQTGNLEARFANAQEDLALARIGATHLAVLTTACPYVDANSFPSGHCRHIFYLRKHHRTGLSVSFLATSRFAISGFDVQEQDVAIPGNP